MAGQGREMAVVVLVVWAVVVASAVDYLQQILRLSFSKVKNKNIKLL